MNTEMARPSPAPRTLAEWRAGRIELLRRQRDDADENIRWHMARSEQLTGALLILEEEARRAAEFERAESEPAEATPVAASAQPESVLDDPTEGLKERAAAAQASTGKKLADYLAEHPAGPPQEPADSVGA